MLVPAESVGPQQPKAERVTLATSATPEFAAQVRAIAERQGRNVSAVVHAALTRYVAEHA